MLRVQERGVRGERGEGGERGEKEGREGERDGREGRRIEEGWEREGEGGRDVHNTHFKILCHIGNQLIYMYSNPHQLSCPGSSVGRALA